MKEMYDGSLWSRQVQWAIADSNAQTFGLVSNSQSRSLPISPIKVILEVWLVVGGGGGATFHTLHTFCTRRTFFLISHTKEKEKEKVEQKGKGTLVESIFEIEIHQATRPLSRTYDQNEKNGFPVRIHHPTADSTY